jgi:hypothetical protein
LAILFLNSLLSLRAHCSLLQALIKWNTGVEMLNINSEPPLVSWSNQCFTNTMPLLSCSGPFPEE